MREYNFDGLVGPTHNYGGLSAGNVASTQHGGQRSFPKQAALQGLAKMKFVAELGVGQAVLPPHPRPSLHVLRQLGFQGRDEEVIAKASANGGHLLRLCSSAAAMWTANAATCAPSCDTEDGLLHLTPANLQEMFHRAIEAPVTYRILKAIFADPQRFTVHSPLPGGGQFADEGAANHTRLSVGEKPALHLFAWGRSAFERFPTSSKYPARQTLEASRALARLHRLDPSRCLFPQQAPRGIDAGAFHTDVLAVGNGDVLLLHQRAFRGTAALLSRLKTELGPSFRYVLASEAELPTKAAVAAYPFNSQLLTLPSGKMAILAPTESEQDRHARRYLDRVVSEDNPVEKVHFLDLRQSMNNGGGPACLRLRVPLTDTERSAIRAEVFFSPSMHQALTSWVERHYRDRLDPEDLADPLLARESMAALDELTSLLKLGSIYDFQT